MNDYHVHLHPHGPHRGVGPAPGVYPDGHIESYVEAAAERGVEQVCFTEHLYRCVESEDLLGPFWEAEPKRHLAEQTEDFIKVDRTLSLEGYVDAVVSAKERGLPVLLGLEVDFFPESIDAVMDFIEPYPWDLLIGSVHWIGGWSLDHPSVVEEFAERGIDRAYEEYYRLEAQLAASGTVDVLAHIDKIKASGHRPATPPEELYELVAKEASAAGVALELNTAGLRSPAAEIYPETGLLSVFHDAGVPITIGSDAHVAAEVGLGFDSARELAGSVGYTERLEFRKRAGTSVPL